MWEDVVKGVGLGRARLYLLLKCTGFSCSQGWLSFRGNAYRVFKLGWKLEFWISWCLAAPRPGWAVAFTAA